MENRNTNNKLDLLFDMLSNRHKEKTEDMIVNKENLTAKEKCEDIIGKIAVLKQNQREEGIMNQFENIEQFILSMSVEEIEFVYDKLIIVSTDPQLSNQHSSYSSTLEPLGVYYLVALKNFDFVHDIDDSILFYIVNSLRSIPFRKYNMALNALTHKKLVRILTNKDIKYNRGKDTDEIRIILYKLMSKFDKNMYSFSSTILDTTMDNFINDTVLPIIGELVNTDYLLIDEEKKFKNR